MAAGYICHRVVSMDGKVDIIVETAFTCINRIAHKYKACQYSQLMSKTCVLSRLEDSMCEQKTHLTLWQSNSVFRCTWVLAFDKTLVCGNPWHASTAKNLDETHNPWLSSAKTETIYAIYDGTPEKLERVWITSYRKDSNLSVRGLAL